MKSIIKSIQKLITKKEQPQLQSQTNAPEKENSSLSGKIQNVEQIENTPFTILTFEPTNGTKENNAAICIGNKRITPAMPYAKARQKIAMKDWNLTTALITLIAEAVKKDKISE